MEVLFIGRRAHRFLDTARAGRKLRSTLVRRLAPVLAALSLGLVPMALAPHAGAATRGPGVSKRTGEKVLFIWAYFDGNTPVSGGTVRVYADGGKLSGEGRGPVRTFSQGEAMLQFHSLPSKLRIVVSGGQAAGMRVRGSLNREVRGVTDGDLVQINPVTTVTDMLAHADRLGLHRARDLTDRTLGIRPILDNSDLYATDRWFDGRRFERWALKRGSVQAGARALVRLIDRPGFDRRLFRPPDAGGSEARVAAACGTATAKDVIGGLADAVASAAGLTGPQGFLVGTAVIFFKQLLGLALPDCDQKAPGEDDVSAQLQRLNAQIAELKNHIDDKFLQLQIADTKKAVQKIENAQNYFQNMLKYARDKNDADLIQATRKFLNLADELTEAPANLDRDLRDRQDGGTKENPVMGPALIPAVRQNVAKERFFTHASSQTIHGFFNYYEWVQTRLAAVLTEYYALGGGCAVIFANSDAHKQELLTSNDCKPIRLEAKRTLDEIQGNVDAQRAILPPVLDPRVAIDRTTKSMWLTKPEVQGNPGIVVYGLRVEERLGKGALRYRLERSTESRDDLTKSLGFSGPWHFPTAADYQGLFAGGEPLARLNDSLGVRYNGKPLEGNPAGYLWLSGDFYSGIGSRARTLDAVLYKLVPGAKSPPATQRFDLASDCDLLSHPVVKPRCGDTWNRNVPAAYIFWWYGPLSDVQGGRYWCQPGKQLSWDAAKC